jgi:hypothetical protein
MSWLRSTRVRFRSHPASADFCSTWADVALHGQLPARRQSAGPLFAMPGPPRVLCGARDHPVDRSDDCMEASTACADVSVAKALVVSSVASGERVPANANRWGSQHTRSSGSFAGPGYICIPMTAHPLRRACCSACRSLNQKEELLGRPPYSISNGTRAGGPIRRQSCP